MPLPLTSVREFADDDSAAPATLLMVTLIVDKDSNRCFCLHKKRLRT